MTGGDSRAQTVMNGLKFIIGRYPDCEWLLVHDAARPCLSSTDLKKLLDRGLKSDAGGSLAVPVNDTLKLADETGCIEHTVDRSRYWAAQTPQLFRIRELGPKLEAALAAGLRPTDEASAMEPAGVRPLLVEGSTSNIKITNAEDLQVHGPLTVKIAGPIRILETVHHRGNVPQANLGTIRACQHHDLFEVRAPVETSKHLRQVMQKVRDQVAPLGGDRYLADDIAAIKQLVMERSIIAALDETDLLPQLKP